MRAGFRFSRPAVLFALGSLVLAAGCSDNGPPEQPEGSPPAAVEDDAVVDDPEPEADAEPDGEVQPAAGDGAHGIENWEMSNDFDLAIGSNPGPVVFVQHGPLLIRSGSSAVNVVDLSSGEAYLVGAMMAGDAPLHGYYEPVAVFDDQLLYRYFDTAEMPRQRLVPLDGSGEPEPVEFPEEAAHLRDDGGILSQDEASGKVVFAVDDDGGFSLHEMLVDASVAPLATRGEMPAQDVPTVTYHLGAAGGAYWFALVEEQDIYLGAQDYLGLYRMDFGSGQVEQVDAGVGLGTKHNLHDLGGSGVAITGPEDLIHVPPTGEVRPLPSALLQEYPGADRDLFDSVRGWGDELLVSGYQMVELHSLSTGGSTVISGTCGLLDADFDSACYFGHTFFGPGEDVTSIYSDSVFTYQRP